LRTRNVVVIAIAIGGSAVANGVIVAQELIIVDPQAHQTVEVMDLVMMGSAVVNGVIVDMALIIVMDHPHHHRRHQTVEVMDLVMMGSAVVNGVIVDLALIIVMTQVHHHPLRNFHHREEIRPLLVSIIPMVVMEVVDLPLIMVT